MFNLHSVIDVDGFGPILGGLGKWVRVGSGLDVFVGLVGGLDVFVGLVLGWASDPDLKSGPLQTAGLANLKKKLIQSKLKPRNDS